MARLPLLGHLALLLWPLLGGCDECAEDYDCPARQVCNLSEGTCERLRCARDEDCPPAHACARNRCQARTTSPPTAESPDALVLTPGGTPGD